ncbi:hypothetical protein M5F66_02410 [Acinetobacter sp. ANC 5033]|uniref:hypothetical protein n=1 Tax=Acinetobacter amyesii TaxID=2942470 RepID=UPI00201B6EB5|nr:hypothetical protein [Acinetobacter amyesii]MCL6237207.1 hypothetical protein [Acinetobacter amyesii]
MSNLHCKIYDLKCSIKDAAWSAEKKIYKTIDYTKENPVKSTAIATTTVLSAGVSYIYAPTIAAVIAKSGVLGKTATTGAVISKLTGAPLVNASLAKIGGGAISIGGKGIAGGKIVIASTTAATTAGSTVAITKITNDK